MITPRQGIEACLVIAVGSALALFVTSQRDLAKRSLNSSAAAPVAEVALPSPTPSGPIVSTMDSPEGSKTLTLEKDKQAYSVFVSAKGDDKRELIFRKEEPTAQTLEIPFNTWSTDNKYVFLKEKTPSQDNYLVLQSSGALFSNDKAVISVQEYFAEKVPGYTIEDVTGWAGNTSLIVNTKSLEGGRRVSFWFEAPSQSFIQLGTYFK